MDEKKDPVFNPFKKKFKQIVDESNVKEKTEEKVEETMEEKNTSFSAELEEIDMDITSEDNSKSEDPDYGLDSPEENVTSNQDLQESELDPDNDPALIAVQNEPEDEKPAEEPPKKKRKRRTKAEMEAARAAEAAEKAAKLVTKEETSEDNESTEEIEHIETEETKEEVSEVKTKKTRAKKEKTEYENPSDCKEFYGSSMDIEGISEDILNNFEVKWFKDFKEEFTTKVNNIAITSDMNVGAIKYALKDINDLRSQLYIPMVKTREIINSLTHKDYGVITAFLAEHAIGDNATDRKAASFKALRNFNVDGKKIDLVETLTGLQFRSEYFESMNKLLDRKQDILLSYIALLKIEAKFDA